MNIHDTLSNSFAHDLEDKARILRECPYFSTGATNYPLTEKQVLFLALVGFKPVAEALSSHSVETRSGRKSVPDDPAQIRSTLEALGLSFRLAVEAHATIATVSLHKAVLDLFESSRNDPTVQGLLFGYPASAVAAFTTGQLMRPEDEDALLQTTRLSAFAMFRLSQGSSRDELDLLHSWHDTLGRFGLT